MKPLLHTLASILFAFCCCQAHALEWKRKAIDLQVPAGTPEVRVQFPFKNTGNSSVHIKQVTTSCGCTEAATGLRDVASGDNSVIYVTFTVGNRTGKQDKKIFVFTDEAADPVELALDMVIAGSPPASPLAAATRTAGQ